MPHPARPRSAGRPRAGAAADRRIHRLRPALVSASALLRPTPSRIALLAVTASLLISLGTLTACGGGELAILGYIGAAGGDFVVDNLPTSTALEPRDCGGGNDCKINLQIDTGGGAPTWVQYYSADFNIIANGQLGGSTQCSNAPGTVRGKTVTIPGCFTGSFRNVNELVSSDGQTLLLFTAFNHNFTEGAWADINEPGRRAVFRSQNAGVASGCWLGDGAQQTATAHYTDPAIRANGTRASVQSVQLGGVTWAATMVGASGLSLSRAGSPTLLLERRAASASDTCAVL